MADNFLFWRLSYKFVIAKFSLSRNCERSFKEIDCICLVFNATSSHSRLEYPSLFKTIICFLGGFFTTLKFLNSVFHNIVKKMIPNIFIAFA